MKKRVIALCLSLVMMVSLAACATSGESRDNGESTEVVFVDDCGREVMVPEKVSRIVSSGSLAQIILHAIAPEMFVGISSKWDEKTEEFISEELLELPYLGKVYSSADLNVEELALADPQIIIDIGEVKDSVKEDMDNLQAQTGIPAVFISATLETMPETYRTLGKLLGKEEKGEELAAFCERIYDRTVEIMEEVGDNKVKVLQIGGEEGLNVLAKGSYHAELLDMLADNVAVIDSPSSKGLGNEVSIEQIVLWNPEVIIFSQESIFENVNGMATWKDLDAIKDENYVEIPVGPYDWMGTPPSVQRYLGMIWLTAELYPEYCDYNVKEDVKEYYRLFYDYEMTDEKFEELTKNAMR